MALRTPHQTKRYHIYWCEPGRPDIYLGTGSQPTHTTKQREAARMTAAQLASTLPDAVEDPMSQRLELCIVQAPVIDGEDARQREQNHPAYPQICRAAYEMAACNGTPFGRDVIYRRLDELLRSEGYDAADLRLIDTWIGALDDEQLSVLVDGEETEMQALHQTGPLPEKASGLMNVIFEQVI